MWNVPINVSWQYTFTISNLIADKSNGTLLGYVLLHDLLEYFPVDFQFVYQVGVNLYKICNKVHHYLWIWNLIQDKF